MFRLDAIIFLSACSYIPVSVASLCAPIINKELKTEAGLRAPQTISSAQIQKSLFGSEAQDSHPYFYRHLLRDPARRAKVEALASEVGAEYLKKHPAATPSEVEVFMNKVNQVIGWRMSDDARGKFRSEEFKEIATALGVNGAHDFETRIEATFKDFADRKGREIDVGIADFYYERLRAENIEEARARELREDFLHRLDALYLADDREHFKLIMVMNQRIHEYPNIRDAEKKEQVAENIIQFGGGLIGDTAHNSDDVLLYSGLYHANSEIAPHQKLKEETKERIIKAAQHFAPRPGDLKSYFEYAAGRIAELHENGVLPKPDNTTMTPLYARLAKEDDAHLRVAPYTAWTAEAFGSYVAYQRLRVLLPDVAKTSPNVRIPEQIVESIITNNLMSGNSRNQYGNPRFREFDAASIALLDRELLAAFRH